MSTSTEAASVTRSQQLPWAALLGLFVAGFIAILTEAMPAGLLPEMANSLGVSTAVAGQTVTIYAIGSVIAAIPLTRLTATWPRRQVLLTALSGLLVANAVTALSSDYALTMTFRLVAGLAAGLIWSLVGGYGQRISPAGAKGKATAVAMGGIPVALALGIPAGTVTFVVASLILVSLSSVPLFVYVGAAAWGLAFGSSGTLFTGAVGAVTGPAADVGQSMLVTVFNAGIALGGLLGGLLLSVFGPWSLAWSALLLTVPVAVTVIVAKRCAFPTDANLSATEPVLNCRMRA